MIKVETATVYRAAGRRWLTKEGAYNALARQAIRKRCECENPDYSSNYPGSVCDLHRDYVRLEKIKRRLVRLYRRRQETSHVQD